MLSAKAVAPKLDDEGNYRDEKRRLVRDMLDPDGNVCGVMVNTNRGDLPIDRCHAYEATQAKALRKAGWLPILAPIGVEQADWDKKIEAEQKKRRAAAKERAMKAPVQDIEVALGGIAQIREEVAKLKSSIVAKRGAGE